MGTDQIMYCIVALILGMLLANMLKNVCGCKVVEGLSPSPAFDRFLRAASRQLRRQTRSGAAQRAGGRAGSLAEQAGHSSGVAPENLEGGAGAVGCFSNAEDMAKCCDTHGGKKPEGGDWCWDQYNTFKLCSP